MSDTFDFVETRTFSAEMSVIQGATDFMAACIAKGNSNVDDGTIFELRLTLTEVFANIVEHAYRNAHGKEMSMTIKVSPELLEFNFEDSGYRPDPAILKSRDLEDYQERGLGLFLISRCMDRFQYYFKLDGTNYLTLTRKLVKRPEPDDDEDQLPFHVAIYETQEEHVLCLIGIFDQERENPFETDVLDGKKAVEIDLSYLESIDETAVNLLADYCQSARSNEITIKVTEPPEKVIKIITESRRLNEIAPDGFVASRLAQWVQSGKKAGSEFPEYFKDISDFAELSSQCGDLTDNDAVVKHLKNIMPKKVSIEEYDLSSALIWGGSTQCQFFALGEYTPKDSWDSVAVLFAGRCFANTKDDAVLATAVQKALSTMTDAFTLRGSGFGVRNFIAEIYELTRNLMSDLAIGKHPELIVLEMDGENVNAWTGSGEPFASVGGTPLCGIPLGISTKLIVREQKLVDAIESPGENSGNRLRVHLGDISDAENAGIAQEGDCASWNWDANLATSDKGVIDIFTKGPQVL